MKKLSERRKRWLLRRAKRSERRRLRLRRSGRAHSFKGAREISSLSLPSTLSFDRNYAATATFFDDLRKTAEAGVPLKIDFTTLKSIGPAAALVLAAELDCWRLTDRGQIRLLDIDKWDQDIRCVLDEMGLFDLVKVKNPPPHMISNRPQLYFIRFRSNGLAVGKLAQELRTDLEAITGQIPGWQHLYRGIVEAMTNVRQHAYPANTKEKPVHGCIQKWWMFGAYDASRKLLTCSFFDRGVGIPATLPLKYPWEKIRRVLSGLGLPETDASLIAAATVMGRTSTGAGHRGGGLADVMAFVKQSEGGRVRILSRRGRYLYDGGRKRPSLLPSPIGGTLIEWKIVLP